MIETRHAARVLLIDDVDRVLLFRIENPFDGENFWVTPGGGLDDGEDHRTAATRELAEETGRDDIEIGPEIWHRDHTFQWGDRTLRQVERWFLARTPPFEVPEALVESLDYEGVIEARWWSVDELRQTTEPLTPRRLASILPAILVGELPDEPVDIGI